MNANLFLFSTDRLGLRQFVLEDADFMMALNADPDVLRYTGDKSFVHLSEVRAVIKSLMMQFDTRRMGRFVVIEKMTGMPIGWCGLKWHEDQQVADIGYRFLRTAWGHGYATEAARACLDYGFNTLGLGGSLLAVIQKIRLL